MSEAPLIAKARLTIATNIAAYFLKRPPRAPNVATAPVFGSDTWPLVGPSAVGFLLRPRLSQRRFHLARNIIISIGTCVETPHPAPYIMSNNHISSLL